MTINLKLGERLEYRNPNEEPCAHSGKQKNCWYYRAGRCECNQAGNQVRVNGDAVEYLKQTMIDKIFSWTLNHQGLTAMIIIAGYFALLWQLGLLEG